MDPTENLTDSPLRPTPEPRDQVLNVRTTVGLKDAVQGAAERLGVDRSEWMRMVLALASGYEDRIPTVAELFRVLDEDASRRNRSRSA